MEKRGFLYRYSFKIKYSTCTSEFSLQVRRNNAINSKKRETCSIGTVKCEIGLEKLGDLCSNCGAVRVSQAFLGKKKYEYYDDDNK